VLRACRRTIVTCDAIVKEKAREIETDVHFVRGVEQPLKRVLLRSRDR
jgi:hypothetical protein